MDVRKHYSSGATWEDIVGYSRAIKIGNVIEISGTTSVRDGQVLHIGDPYLQAKEIINIAKDVIVQAGGTLSDVVRTRIYVTDINNWEAIGKAHGEFFRDIKPATTLVEVSRLIDADMLVEIEFTAYLRG
ncbi:RidA family protein [Saprospiraceae bacterium]|nr:RidA family protein [Saprospiraceae bacterium]